MKNQAKLLVEEVLKNDNSGHGMEHINRVIFLAEEIAENENCDKDIVYLTALLHDVDDYKLFGAESQENLTNTNRILSLLSLDNEKKQNILKNIKEIGFSKRLKGITPESIEAKIVSDADMCDAIGANGIVRTHQYCASHNQPFFDKNIFPVIQTADSYTKKGSETAVCHFFEKILKLKNLMLTEKGKEIATQRHNFMINFLKQYFLEENTPEWQEYMDEYLNNL